MLAVNPKPRIAVCLFGQYRTGDYCLPWLKEMFDHLADRHNAKVDYFGCIKNFETHVNLNNLFTEVTPTVDVREKVIQVVGESLIDLCVMSEVDVGAKNIKGSGVWHYYPLVYSWVTALRQVCKQETRRSFQYDLVFLVRTDLLPGPTVHSLADAVDMAEFLASPLSQNLYAIGGVNRYDPGSLLGVGDFMMWGTSLTTSLLLGQLAKVCAEPKGRVWIDHWPKGPNTLLYEAAHECSLDIKTTNLDVALVRPGSDTSKPAKENWLHHRTFWRNAHPAIKDTV